MKKLNSHQKTIQAHLKNIGSKTGSKKNNFPPVIMHPISGKK
jgi:hypothetical protein